MRVTNGISPSTLFADVKSGLVVFFVALPLCLGIALASDAPLVSGLLAGNITSRKVLASAEYGCAVARAKLIVVIGHTRCGAVSAAVKFLGSRLTAAEATGCQHLDAIVNEIQRSADGITSQFSSESSSTEALAIVDAVARENVL